VQEIFALFLVMEEHIQEKFSHVLTAAAFAFHNMTQ